MKKGAPSHKQSSPTRLQTIPKLYAIATLEVLGGVTLFALLVSAICLLMGCLP